LRRRMVVAPDWQDDPTLSALLKELPAIRPERISQRLKDKAVSLVAKVRLGEREVIVKQYRTHSLGKRLSRALRYSKAYRCWWAGEQMQSLGIPSMRGVAYFERRLGPMQFDPVFIGTVVEGPDMIEYISQFSLDEPQWTQSADAVIERVAMLHDHGLIHGDLNWTNIRFSDEGPSFLDLDDMRAPRLAARRRYLMVRDWRVLIYNWRDRPEMQARFAERVQARIGEDLFAEVSARPFRP